MHRAGRRRVAALGFSNYNPDEKLAGGRLAQHLGVTKGAVSQTLAKLVRKKLVRKRKAPTSGREVVLELTPLGWRGFHAHERFHAEAFAAVREYFQTDVENRVTATRRALEDLIGMLDVFERRTNGM